MTKFKYEQLVLVEFHNTPPFIYKFKSNKKLTVERVWKYLNKLEEMNEDRDSITFIDEIYTYRI